MSVDYEAFIGMPYNLIKNPFDTEFESYGEHFEHEFMDAVKDLGIEVNAMYFSPNQDRLYLQGLDETGALTAYTFEFR